MLRDNSGRKASREPFFNLGERFVGLPIIGLFILLAVLGSFLGPPVQGVVWTTAFAMIAGRCLQHGWRCARVVCLVTGPFYSVVAAIALLLTTGWILIPWRRVWLIFYTGTALAFGTEFILSASLGSKYLLWIEVLTRHKYTLAIWGAIATLTILVFVLITG